MADTLPPGWTGDWTSHRLPVSGFTIHVEWRAQRRTFEWWVTNAPEFCAGDADTAPLARRAALTALLALLTTATREAEQALAGLEP